ncbi:hypothetical protein HDK64DRAFT_26545 [Phyllosticta capitalensis]
MEHLNSLRFPPKAQVGRLSTGILLQNQRSIVPTSVLPHQDSTKVRASLRRGLLPAPSQLEFQKRNTMTNLAPTVRQQRLRYGKWTLLVGASAMRVTSTTRFTASIVHRTLERSTYRKGVGPGHGTKQQAAKLIILAPSHLLRELSMDSRKDRQKLHTSKITRMISMAKSFVPPQTAQPVRKKPRTKNTSLARRISTSPRTPTRKTASNKARAKGRSARTKGVVDFSTGRPQSSRATFV